MAGLGVRLFTDEMISPRLAEALRARNYDVQSCEEAGRSRQEIPDDEQLLYATQTGRAILTFNATDFYRIEAEWKAAGQRHAGIILSPQIQDVGALLRYVMRHLDSVEPNVQTDTLLWLDTGR